MKTDFQNKVSSILVWLFFFTLPWQTKLILGPAGNNYSEIALYFFQFSASLLLTWEIICLLRRSDLARLPRRIIMLVVLELLIFASIFFAPYPLLGLFRYLALFLGLTTYVVFQYLEPGKSATWQRAFLWGLLPSLLLGVWQFLFQSSFASSWLGLALHDPTILGTSVIEAGGRFLRPYGSFDHPNIFGGISALATLLSASVFFRQRRPTYLFFSFFFFFCAFISFSRAVWLALAIGAAILVFERLVLGWRKAGPVIPWVASLFLFSLVLTSLFLPLISSRVSLSGRLEQKSIEERASLWQQGKEVFSGNLLTGVGLGNYIPYLMEKDMQKQPDWQYQPVHNSFLLFGSEIGIFGLAVFLGFFILVFVRSVRSGYLALTLPLFVLMSFDHWFWSLPFGLLFLFVFLAVSERKDEEGIMR